MAGSDAANGLYTLAPKPFFVLAFMGFFTVPVTFLRRTRPEGTPDPFIPDASASIIALSSIGLPPARQVKLRECIAVLMHRCSGQDTSHLQAVALCIQDTIRAAEGNRVGATSALWVQ